MTLNSPWNFSKSLLYFRTYQAKYSLLQLWCHVTFICILRWHPPHYKFLNFECKYLENQKWYRKTTSGILSSSACTMYQIFHPRSTCFGVNFLFNFFFLGGGGESASKIRKYSYRLCNDDITNFDTNSKLSFIRSLCLWHKVELLFRLLFGKLWCPHYIVHSSFLFIFNMIQLTANHQKKSPQIPNFTMIDLENTTLSVESLSGTMMISL